MSTTEEAPKGITAAPVRNVGAWAKAGQHTITCPTGTRVTIRIPDLADMIEGGELPQHLLDAALEAAGNQAPESADKKVTAEDIKRDHEFTHFLVARTLVEPKITPEEAAQVPQEDKEFIAAIALRLREWDAEGSHIFGLDASAKFRKFRQVGEFEPTVEGD